MKSGVGGLKFHEISFRLKFHIQALHETYTYTTTLTRTATYYLRPVKH